MAQPRRRAPQSSRRTYSTRSGGTRAARATRRRTHGLPGTLGLTLAGAMLPGSGYLYAGRRALGAVILLAWLCLLGSVAWYFGRDLGAAVDFAFDPVRLKIAAVALGVGILVWAFVVFTSYRMVRPRQRPRWHTIVGNVAVVVLCVTVAAPAAMAARYAVVQADLVETVFEGNVSATAPRNVSESDPWAGEDRVNVLLLGGDGGEGRDGVRTDSVILISMNTRTGEAVTFSLPRNMMYAQFPDDSPLHDLYPDGYDGDEDDAFYMLNAVYGQIPARHPGILGKSDNEGADAIKQAVSGSLGVPVHYYVLVNLAGFREVVDAIGGVTVNINEPVAIEGNTDLGIPPVDYLDPGPDQDLDGYEALWFARGRWGSDDYERMERQRCMVSAIVEAADPITMLSRYQSVAAAGKKIVFTDIPLELAPAFVDLALKVKDRQMKSVVFRNSDEFFSGDPDYDYLRAVVDKALSAPVKQPGSPRDPTRPPDPESTEPPELSPGDAAEAEDVCAYNPTGETVSASE